MPTAPVTSDPNAACEHLIVAVPRGGAPTPLIRLRR
jgi:hypothetical protein